MKPMHRPMKIRLKKPYLRRAEVSGEESKEESKEESEEDSTYVSFGQATQLPFLLKKLLPQVAQPEPVEWLVHDVGTTSPPAQRCGNGQRVQTRRPPRPSEWRPV